MRKGFLLPKKSPGVRSEDIKKPTETAVLEQTCLPLELLHMIFKMLPPRDLTKCRSVCRQWNRVIRDEETLMGKIWYRVDYIQRMRQTERCIQEAGKGNVEFFRFLVDIAPAPKNRRAAKHLDAYKSCIAPDPNPVDAGGWTPLHKVAEKGHLELYRLIMSKCEDTNPANDAGITPFNWAARERHLEVCRLIMDTLKDKNPVGIGSEGYPGWTPLHWAAFKGHLEVCRLILEQCDEKNPADTNGVTPLYMATKYGRDEVAALIKSYL